MQTTQGFTQWEAIIESLPSGIILVTQPGELLKINPKAFQLLGLPAPEEGHSSNLRDWPDYLHDLTQLLMETTTDQTRSEVVVSLPGGKEPTTLGYTLKNLQQPDGTGVKLFIFSDITQVIRDRLAFEKIAEELHQSQRLASVGTMISGVAHELNNPITGISMSCELARKSLERLQKQLPEVASHPCVTQAMAELGKIRSCTNKASALVQDLLTYGKPSKLDLSILSVESFLDECIQALKSHPTFSFIHFERSSLDQPIHILGDKIKLEQVFYNLFKNASEAMGGKGSIQVYYTETEDKITIHVRDEGPGMETTLMNRIFDPFFTTKGHEGVGLGLSVSYQTIERHGGQLMVNSEKGSWTEFLVVLPKFTDELLEGTP